MGCATSTCRRAAGASMQRFGCSVTEASALCAATPAAVPGERRKGRLAAGTAADLVLFDAELNVRATVVDGAIAYQSSS